MKEPKPSRSQFFSKMRAELLKQQNGLCEHCSDPINDGEPTTIYDGVLMHSGCASEDMDDEPTIMDVVRDCRKIASPEWDQVEDVYAELDRIRNGES